MTIDGLKHGRAPWLEQIAGHISQRWQEGLFHDFLGPDVVILPAPGHAPIHGNARRIWPIQDLATKLEQYTLGRRHNWLLRTTKVQKSAFAAPGERPTSGDHYSTIELCQEARLFHPTRVTVLDDVVARGATLHACVRRVRGTFPDAEIRALAVVRALGNVTMIDDMKDPVEDGTIILHPSGITSRKP